jgi:site-specific recombinase XerD
MTKKITKKSAAEPWLPPRGIRYSFRKHRPKPFYLHWAEVPGKEKSTAFESEEEREIKARQLADKRETHGRHVLSFDPARWASYEEFQRIVGTNIDPVIVAHEWVKSKQGTPRADSLALSEAAQKYFELRRAEKSWGRVAERHAEKHLGRLVELHGKKRLNEVGREDVRNWLAELKDRKGNPIGPHGRKDHLKNTRTFFDYALRERWGAVENPCQWVKPPKTDDGDPVVIPLRDAFQFFKANRDERAVARVALEAFGGIRYTTAGIIGREAINFDGRDIRMRAGIHKTGKRDGRTRYRQGHTGNLWEWLARAPEKTWGMTALEYREEKRYAAVRAGIRPIATSEEGDREKVAGLRNIWRHSFISYHLAAFKNTPLTQYLAQHANPKTTEEYEGMADETDAKRYFMISPETVKLSWEEFLRLPVTAAP